MTFSSIGLFWLILYLVSLVAIIWYSKRKQNSSDPAGKSILKKRVSFYLGGTTPFHRVPLIFTFAATLFSAFFMIGLPGFLYTHGIGTWPYVIFGDVLGMLLLYYVGKRIILLQTPKTVSPLELIFNNSFSKILFVIITTIFILPYLAG